MGWGWSGVALRHAPSTTLDRVCVAPGMGAGVGVLTGFAVLVAGADPSGPAGLVAASAVALAGILVDRRFRDRPTQPFPRADASPGQTAAPAPSATGST